MGGRVAGAMLCCAAALAAAEVTVSVFGLFRPSRLFVSRAGRSMTVTEAVRYPDSAEWRLEVPGRIARTFTGKLSIAKRDGALEPAITMNIETAVASSVAAEMPADAPEEALKAAAVLARSFYAASGRTRFCDTTHCQFLRSPTPATIEAARATAGLLVTYRGFGIAPLYSSSCGGQTRAGSDVGITSDSYPYFSVRCARCNREESDWTRRVDAANAGRLLHERTEQARLAYVRRFGWSALPGNNYQVRREGDVLVFHGRGQGHGVGVCQKGVIAMARQGAGFRDILRHYLPDTRVE